MPKKIITFKVWILHKSRINLFIRMKRFKLLLLLTFSILHNSFSQTLEEQEKQIAANNHIKSKIQFDYKYADGKMTKTGVKSTITTYAHSGEIVEVDYLDSKGQPIGGEKYDYNSNGNRILFQRDGSNSKYKKVSEYDAKNNITLETGFNGAENFRNEYYYSSGRLSNSVFKVNNKIDQKLVYEYSGNTAKISIFAGGTTLTSKIKMVYDQSNNLIEETHYGINGKEFEKKTYKYNAASQNTEESKVKDGKLYYKITQEYDSKGRLVKVSEETMAKPKYIKKSYTYDAVGNLIEFKWRRNPDEEFNVKTYTYDSKGICLTEHTLYPATHFELMSKFEYEYF
jgi:hypothetical protein